MSIGSMLVRHAPESAAVVRHEVAADLRMQGVPQSCIDDVLLVVTELLSNAIVHSAADTRDLGVAWEVRGSTVTIRVEDHSPELPRPRRASEYAADGRGLTIVAALAREWGVTCTGDGKQVWASVPQHRASASEAQRGARLSDRQPA